MDCHLCEIAKNGHPHEVWSDDRIIVFLDWGPIRPGHLQVVPRAHHETFEVTPPDLAAHVVHVGQRMARAQKRLYGVDRVAFLFTGGDIAHTHAHVVPMVEKTDITSRQYIQETDLTFRSIDRPPLEKLEQTQAELISVLETAL